MKKITLRKRMMAVLAAMMVVQSVFAATHDEANQYGLVNMGFDDSTCWLHTNLRTYRSEVTDGEVSSLQEVTGWTRNGTEDGKCGGAFAFADTLWVGKSDYKVPNKNYNGTSDGGALALLACWGVTAQYTQDVILPAGVYTFTFTVYNVSGITGIQKNLMGFIADDGTEYLAKRLSYSIGKWIEETVTFTLYEDTKGKVSVGYQSAGKVSTVMPKLFVDYVEVERTGDVVLATGVTLSETTRELKQGESFNLVATLIPDNTTVKGVTWSSSDTEVAIVDANGKVTADLPGTAIITATTRDNTNLSASCEVTVNYNHDYSSSILVNEVMQSNIDMYVDPSWNYGGWIELFNTTDEAINLARYYISEDSTNLKQFQFPAGIGSIPAHGYKVIWFDHNSADGQYGAAAVKNVRFKLNYDGGAIYLSDPNGNLVISQEYPQAIARTSYARKVNGGDEWGYTSRPSPGKTNINSTFSEERLDPPVVDADGGLFTGTKQINVTFPVDALLRYTTDGTTPTRTNGETSHDGHFSISETTIYRFCLIQDGKLPSEVVTRTYIKKDKNYYLPILSVVTAPDNLYDDSLGIYVRGVNGRSGLGQSSKCNWNMDWERPANVEYITSDGQAVINQELDICMSGGWSRAWEPHSLKLKADKRFEGANTFDYQFFDDKPNQKHRVLVARNGGNDNNCRYIDAAVQRVLSSSGFYIDTQASQPVHHFLNGKYIGMLNLREPNNKSFAYSNYGYDIHEVDQFELSPDISANGHTVLMAGTSDAYNEWQELAKNADDDEVYQQICEMVDIDEYINYMAAEFFLGGNDWITNNNNIKWFKGHGDGKFHFVVFDGDQWFTMDNLFSSYEGMGNTVATTLKNMFKNKQFCRQFVDAFCIVAGSVFEPERAQAIAREFAQTTEAALQMEGRSPWSSANNVISKFTKSRNNSQIDRLRSYSRLGISSTLRQNIQLSSNIDEATLQINGQPVPTGRFDGILFSPVTLKVQAPAGYEFKGWIDQTEAQMEKGTIFPLESQWSYYYTSSLDNANWKALTYNENGWATGQGGFGFGNDGKPMANAKTVLPKSDAASNPWGGWGWGGNTSNYSCYYFRHSFNIDHEPFEEETYTINYDVDDGAIFYVNGTEVGLYHMQSGAGYSSYTEDNGHGDWYEGDDPYHGTITIPVNLLRQGKNVIAVEVHNCSSSSSDLWFDASLVCSSPLQDDEEDDEEVKYVSTDLEFEMPDDGNHNFVAVFDTIPHDSLIHIGSLPVMINEVSAANTVYANEYFKRNDWIELYNTTNEPYDIDGMYLSDKAKNPYKFRITAQEGINTVIPPHGYLVVWADKLEPTTQIHTQFNLGNDDGEVVILTSAEKEWADTLVYQAHLGTQTVGRYPDGGSLVYLMDIPTIGDRNTIDSYALFLADTSGDKTLPEQHEEDAINNMIADGTIVRTEYFTADGRAISQPVDGITIVRYTYRNGTKTVKKIMNR